MAQSHLKRKNGLNYACVAVISAAPQYRVVLVAKRCFQLMRLRPISSEMLLAHQKDGDGSEVGAVSMQLLLKTG